MISSRKNKYFRVKSNIKETLSTLIHKINNVKWKYYQHALIPDFPPHVVPKRRMSFKYICKLYRSNGGKEKPYFARYCTNFDCKEETLWWYLIKDKPLDISVLTSKQRYEINKGIKRVDVKIINPVEYAAEMYEISAEANDTYPIQNKATLNKKEDYLKEVEMHQKNGWVVFGAFLRNGVEKNYSGQLCGFLVSIIGNGVIYLSSQKALERFEKHGVNASLVYSLLEKFSSNISIG